LANPFQPELKPDGIAITASCAIVMIQGTLPL
jgi:hypothetical protein